MKYNKILLCMTALAACLLIGIAFGQDYLGGENVNYGRTDDPGLAGMLQWLDTPVPNFPWYTTGGSFYSQPYSDITFSPYREYYTTTGTPVVGGIVSNPAKFDITQKTPSSVYYGAGVGLPYSQYASIVPSKTNDLWIQGATNWTQYAVVPVGTWLQLVANAPVGGPAGFYEIIQTGTNTVKYNTYQFNPGYNTMNFNAGQVGRHMLYFVVNNQPSNVVIVDAFAQATGNAAAGIYPAGTQTPLVLGKAANPGELHHYDYIQRPDHHYSRWSVHDNLGWNLPNSDKRRWNHSDNDQLPQWNYCHIQQWPGNIDEIRLKVELLLHPSFNKIKDPGFEWVEGGIRSTNFIKLYYYNKWGAVVLSRYLSI